MFKWIAENLATIIVCVVLLSIVSAVIVNMVNNKKKGKSSCGCSCSSCPRNGQCGSEGE